MWRECGLFDDFSLKIAEGEMQRARKLHALLAISFLLVTSSVRGNSQVQMNEKRTLLDLIVQVIGDSNNSRENGKILSRRYSESVVDSADRRLSSKERTAPAPRPSSRRPIEIFSRDPTLKDKFLNHFTGPVTFSAECNKHFFRVYHNTKDCSTPAYYKRCARLLTRLALSPLCSQ
ncbi:ALK and LTK ligand 1 [Spea bombifrons]|uniref:ALK and LTK ligand 1 n=1 Tax=Spea bombifrons TaxID=233779 RepID=UPI00234B9767|nr:ALK and LTK ligand 1 [Spea bombifrons]